MEIRQVTNAMSYISITAPLYWDGDLLVLVGVLLVKTSGTQQQAIHQSVGAVIRPLADIRRNARLVFVDHLLHRSRIDRSAVADKLLG